jgi:DNA repair protein RadC
LPKVSSALAAAKLVRGLGFSEVERFWVIALDIQGRVIGVRETNRGSFKSGKSTPRNIFSFLLDVRADRGITAQNISASELEPDAFDHVFVTRLVELGELLGIPIVDHLVISRDGYQSVAEGGWRDE